MFRLQVGLWTEKLLELGEAVLGAGLQTTVAADRLKSRPWTKRVRGHCATCCVWASYRLHKF